MLDVTGTTIVLAGAHHRDHVILDAMHQLRDLGATVIVQIVNDAAVDDMRSLAIELLAQPRIDVLAHVGVRHSFEGAVLQPYLLTRLLADRVAAHQGRVLWSVDPSYRGATFDPDAPPQRGKHADGPHQLARALLVHEWPRRDDRIGSASFEPDAAALVQLCRSDESLRGDILGADDALAARLWDRCASATRLDP